MEALFLLIALAALFGVVAYPAMRRRRLRQEGRQGLVQAVDPGAGYGFVPAEQLDVRLPGPDRELVEALEESQRTQDWEPVARMLALTGDEYELRWQRVQSLAGAAAMELARARERAREAGAEGPADVVSFSKERAAVQQDARWLRQWRAQQPHDHGGAQVYAQFLVFQALAEPGSADHRIILEEARNVAHDAAQLAPADPTPHITELHIARRLNYREADFASLWDSVRRLAPDHMGAHLAALPYWSAKSMGSKEQADGFARAAAAHAPEGSLLAALPLFAAYDHLPEVNMVRGLYASEEISHAIEAAEYAVDQVDDDHPVRPHVLHLLVWFLVRAERYGEAMEALAAVDGHVGAVPWVDEGDPAATYAAYRALAVAGWESTGGARASQP
ncbi:hypothetical protein [Streptomyces reniochalinae]|uniref:DUF4034 domain-containing protein n=1 Tax=Streptomyces reniochalinae TaxID=2250578 RepID=A0A367EMN6_9ACTN|nr:hypothetical protein [Streptomyces reniochalinae]RCG19378.1 hypothetical protein DQ392_12070 [Streptomyces reniochalinae]